MGWKRWTLGGLVLVVATTVGLWQLARSRTLQVFGDFVPRVETDQPLVALTFDDGPTPRALTEVLPMLRELDVPATFFVTGAELERHAGLGAALVAAGHELGNHSYSHRRMLLRSPAFIAEEVERTDALIRAAGQTGPVHFRPPYGLRLFGLPHYLARTGRTTVLWDLEPDSDPAIADDADAMAAQVIERARPGSIILLHVMYAPRAASRAAVPAIVTGLRARGFRFVTVSQLMQAARAPAEARS
jgi:peptidoglycan/xylan/chitin deacetylase (PgdA/CDA1 family)